MGMLQVMQFYIYSAVNHLSLGAILYMEQRNANILRTPRRLLETSGKCVFNTNVTHTRIAQIQKVKVFE